MKKLLLLALLVAAGWYGWNHRDTLLKREGSHHAVVINDTGEDVVRLRVTVDGQTLVREKLPAGQRAELPFRVANDSDFRLVWEWVGRQGESNWRGGEIAKGPLLQRHFFQILGDGSVIYRAESKAVGTAP